MILGVSIAPFDAAWLASVLALATPLLLAATGELISERAGVLNVGLEGMMLSGAFFAYYVSWETGSLLIGFAAGVGGGLIFGVLMGLIAIEVGADQIVAGIGINLAAFGLTAYLFDQVFSNQAQAVVSTLGTVNVPLLSDLPDVGKALLDHDVVLFLAFALVPVASFVLYKTRWGLALRACGETPEAAETAGVSVRRVQWLGVLSAASLAGIAGAYLTIVEVGIFKQGMTDGRGFLALVAVIFGRWRPLGVLGACLVLGAADALQLRLATASSVPQVVWAALVVIAASYAVFVLARRNRGRARPALMVMGAIAAAGMVLFATTPHVFLPDQLWRSLPYLLALIVLAGGVAYARMPSRLGLTYRRGG